MKMVIKHITADGEVKDRVALMYDDADTQTIASTVIAMVSSRMSMDEGDSITVTAES